MLIHHVPSVLSFCTEVFIAQLTVLKETATGRSAQFNQIGVFLCLNHILFDSSFQKLLQVLVLFFLLSLSLSVSDFFGFCWFFGNYCGTF